MLACAQVDESRQEQRGEHVEQPILPAEFAGDEVKHRPGDDAKPEPVGDGIGERNQHHGEKSRNGDQRLVPANLSDRGQHERAHQDERGGGGGGGHNAHEGSGDDGAQKQQPGNDGGDAAGASRSYAGGGLHITGDGGRAGEGAEDGGGGVGEQDAVEPRDGVVGGDETRALGYGD